MHDVQTRGRTCFDYHQGSLSAGCLPASHPWRPNGASPSPTSWASIALQQLALQSMQARAAHSSAYPLNAAAAAQVLTPPPVFDPALLRQLCGSAGFGVNSGPLLAPGLSPGLGLAPVQRAYGGGAGFGGLACGAWGL